MEYAFLFGRFLTKIDLFLMAAKEQLAGKEFNLNLSSPKVNYHRPKSTNLPDRLKTRQLSIMVVILERI